MEEFGIFEIAPEQDQRADLVMVLFEMCASKNGVRSEIERKYGLCPRSAWFLCHRIREAMATPYVTLFQGLVMADEAYIGGDPKKSATRSPRAAPRARTERATRCS